MRRLTPTLLACLAGTGLVVVSAALGLGAGSQPKPSTPPPAALPAVTTPVPSQPGGGYGSTAPGGTAPATTAAPVSLTIQDFTFTSPASAAPGATVAVTNRDSAAHTVTARDGGFDSGTVEAGQAASLAAPGQAGQYEFFCSIHPEMTGTLTVG